MIHVLVCVLIKVAECSPIKRAENSTSAFTNFRYRSFSTRLGTRPSKDKKSAKAGYIGGIHGTCLLLISSIPLLG